MATPEPTPTPDSKSNKQPRKMLRAVFVNRESQMQIACGRGDNGHVPADKVLFLQPGANLVPDELWTEAKKLDSVKAWLREKIKASKAPEQSPERVGHAMIVEGIAVDAESPLRDMNEAEALRFVEESFVVRDPSKPNAWNLDNLEKAGDTRPLVMRAIRDQIAKIEDPKRAARAAAAKGA